MKEVEVTNQAELDAALAAGNYPICVGTEFFEISGNSQVTARGNSQVTAWGNSQVTARENSQVTARENSQVTARENSQVTARGNSQILAADAAKICAGRFNAVTRVSPSVTVDGGVLIEPPAITTALDWCEFYGVEVADGIALVYKAVADDYKSPRGQNYAPDSIPKADDWDGGKAECGGGLHFSPSPGHALSFFPEAIRFLACPILLSEIVIHADARYPEKIKVSGACAPVYEVDIAGRRTNATSDAEGEKR